jgi:predicted Zn-dependent protease
VRGVRTRIGADDSVDRQVADGWTVGVRSARDGLVGAATGNVLDEASLAQVLEDARRVRRLAPREHVAPAPVGEAFGVGTRPGAGRPDGLAAAEEIGRAARAAAGRHEALTVTVGTTSRHVFHYDSAGRRGFAAVGEAQLHLRSAAPGLDAVQGARIRADLAGLRVDDAVAELDRAHRALSAPAAEARRVDWLLLAPLTVARIVGRLSRAFVRSPRPRPGWEPGTVLGTGRQVLVLVDDGAHPAGPGATPFDDEGTPRQRTTLLDRGTVAGLLGCNAVGPSTGSAQWSGWDGDVVPAGAACHLEPTTDAPAPDLGQLTGDGFVAEDLRGFRGGLDLTTSRVEFEVSGAVVRDGRPVGSGRTTVSASPGAFLGAFERVWAGTEFYRIQGLHGGSWCLLNGSVVRGDD